MDADDASGLDRAELLDHLRREPGLRPTDVARTYGVHPSTAEYHLRVLERRGQVARVEVGRQLHHYPAGQGWCRRARAIHARLTRAARALLWIALDRAVFPRKAIVDAGHSASAVRWAIGQLEEIGVVEKLAWGVYELVEGVEPCVRAALDERPCTACNELAAGQVRRATSSPSPNGRIDASRSS